MMPAVRSQRADVDVDDLLLRKPPHNIEAEQVLLGTILVNNEAHDRVSNFLLPEHFFDPVHVSIYQVAAEVIGTGKRAMPITLTTFFETAEPVSPGLTVPQYLRRLVLNATTINNAIDYGRTVHELFLRRELIKLGERIFDAAYDAPVETSPADQIDEAVLSLEALRRSSFPGRSPGPISASSFEGLPVPDREWHIPEYVPKGNITLFSADGAVGKSLVLQQLGICTAAKLPWLGLVTAAGPTLYLNAEDNIAELHRRTADISKLLSVPLSQLNDVHLWSMAGEDALLATADERNNVVTPTPLWAEVRRRVSEIRPVLVILDPLADLFGGNENVKPQARAFVGMCRGLAIDFDTTVILAAHPSQTGLQNRSGSSGNTGWGNSVRSRIFMERIKERDAEPDPDARILRKTKSNYGALGGDEIRFRYYAGAFTLEGATTLSESRRAVDHIAAESLFLETLDQLASQGMMLSPLPGKNYAPSRIAAHPNAEAQRIGAQALRRAMQTLLDAGRIRSIIDGPKSRQRTILRRP